MNKHLASAKKFVVAHKTAIAVAATSTLLVVVHINIIKQHNDFLEEHDLLDTFYTSLED